MSVSRDRANLTGLLQAAHAGDPDAIDAAFRSVEHDLRKIVRAKRHYQNRGEPTTALIDAVYMEFLAAGGLEIENRAHFFGWAARVVLTSLIAEKRRASASKRGANAGHVSLELIPSIGVVPDYETALALKSAYEELEQTSPEAAEIFVRHFVFGQTVDEIASEMILSTATITRRILYIRGFFNKKVENFCSA